MSLLKKNRCSRCKEEKKIRTCPRTGKKICWHCCNSIRFDMKCPPACEYQLPQTNGLEFNIKADSIAESNDLVMRLFDIWTMKINPDLGNKAPLELSTTEEGKEKLEKYFSNIKFQDILPLNKMRNRLKLSSIIDLPVNNNFELFAEKIMQFIVDEDWESIADNYYHQEQLAIPEKKDNFIKRHKKFKVFKKIKHYSIISSSFNKEANEALVYFDINKKADITINVIKVEDEWKLKSRIIGDPQLYYGEDTAIKHIASLLNQNDMDQVFKLCYQYSTIYPDSADIEYYWGLFYSITENIKEAKKHFEISFILDPTFAEPLYNIAFIHQVEKNNEQAEKIYRQVLKLDPKEVKTINNLAILHIEKKEWSEALSYLEKCIEINPDYDIAQKNYEIVKKQLREEENKK